MFIHMISKTPTPPYYAVIFSSTHTAETENYADMASHMVELASTMDGFLGIESAREEIGITVSYWRDLESIKAWKDHPGHLVAQNMGQEKWYGQYTTRIAKVEREYSFEKED